MENTGLTERNLPPKPWLDQRRDCRMDGNLITVEFDELVNMKPDGPFYTGETIHRKLSICLKHKTKCTSGVCLKERQSMRQVKNG